MSGNAGVLNIQLKVKDDGTVKVRQFGNEAEKAGAKTEKGFRRAGRTLGDINTRLLTVKSTIAGLVAGLAITKIADDFLQVAASFEAMEIQLNTLTKGRGKETLTELNRWALDMPVNTQKAVDSFRLMTAMGLDPTIKSLETLTDVASIFGDDVLNRLALQLGQASAKGKIMAQDLNIMAEAGINARKYLKDAYGMTVEEIQTSSIDIRDIIGTIFAGMERDFGGSAKAMMNTWRGLTTVTKSYFVEIERTLMESGIFDKMKQQLGEINTALKSYINWLKGPDIDTQIASLESTIESLTKKEVSHARTREEYQKAEIKRIEALKNSWAQALNAQTVSRGSMNLTAVPLPETAQGGAKLHDQRAVELAKAQQQLEDLREKKRFQLEEAGLKKRQEIARKEAAEKQKRLDAELNARRVFEEEKAKIAEEFSDKYLKSTLNEYEYSRAMIEKERKHFEDFGMNKVKLAEWVAAELKKVDQTEAQEKIKRLERYEADYQKAISDPYDYELKLLEEARKAREKDGFDAVKLAEWVAAEKKRIAEERKKAEEEDYSESLRGWTKFEQLAAESNSKILKTIQEHQEKKKSSFAWMFDKDIWKFIDSKRGDKDTAAAYFQGMAIDAKDAFQTELGGFFTDALRLELDSGLDYFRSFTSDLQGIWGNAMAKMMMTPAMWTGSNFATMGIAGIALAGVGSLLGTKDKKRAEDKEKRESRDRLNAQLFDSIAKLELSDFGYELYQTTSQLSEMANEAARTSADIEKLNKLRELETDRLKEEAAAYYEKSISDATAPFDTILDKYTNWKTGRERADWNINDWQAEVDKLGDQFAELNANDAEYFDVAEKQLDAIMTLVDVAEQQLASYESTQKSLDAQIWDLTGGDPLGAVDLKAYQAKYDALLTEAKTLDVGAIAEFQSFATDYLRTMDDAAYDHAVTADKIATDLGQLSYDLEDPMVALREAIDKNTGVVGTDSVNAMNRLVDTLMLDRQEKIRDTWVGNAQDFALTTRTAVGYPDEMGFDVGGFGNNAGGVTGDERALMNAIDAMRLQGQIWDELVATMPADVLSDKQLQTVERISAYFDQIPNRGNYNPYISNSSDARSEKYEWFDILNDTRFALDIDGKNLESQNKDLAGALLEALNNKTESISSEEIGQSIARSIAPLIQSATSGSGELPPIKIIIDGKELADVIVDQAEGGHEELMQTIRNVVN